MIAITTSSSISVKPRRLADFDMESSLSSDRMKSLSRAGTSGAAAGAESTDLRDISPYVAANRRRRTHSLTVRSSKYDWASALDHRPIIPGLGKRRVLDFEVLLAVEVAGDLRADHRHPEGVPLLVAGRFSAFLNIGALAVLDLVDAEVVLKRVVAAM